jgi:hypothetical protein
MKKFLSAVTICSLTLSSAFASTTSLEKCSEFKKLNRLSSLQVQYHSESVEMYKELAYDAGNTANLSLGIFTASSLVIVGLANPAAYAGFEFLMSPLTKAADALGLIFPALESSTTYQAIFSIVGISTPFAGSVAAIGNGIYRLSNDETKISIELSRKDLEKSLTEIDSLLRVVKTEREKVDLNYSKLRDMVTLGGKSAKTTKKLYQLAQTEHELLVSKKKIAEALEKGSCN